MKTCVQTFTLMLPCVALFVAGELYFPLFASPIGAGVGRRCKKPFVLVNSAGGGEGALRPTSLHEQGHSLQQALGSVHVRAWRWNAVYFPSTRRANFLRPFSYSGGLFTVTTTGIHLRPLSPHFNAAISTNPTCKLTACHFQQYLYDEVQKFYDQ